MKNRILLVLCLLSFYLSSEAQKDNYGAGAANVRFIPSKGLLGGRTDFDYLKLENHPGNSGVPLGELELEMLNLLRMVVSHVLV